jgi:hypothetical protein
MTAAFVGVANRRVGIVGAGKNGVAVIVELAPEVKEGFAAII